MTKIEINSLTEKDVQTAKQNVLAARATREGVSTIDYVLSQVGGTRTLEKAKKHLLSMVK